MRALPLVEQLWHVTMGSIDYVIRYNPFGKGRTDCVTDSTVSRDLLVLLAWLATDRAGAQRLARELCSCCAAGRWGDPLDERTQRVLLDAASMGMLSVEARALRQAAPAMYPTLVKLDDQSPDVPSPDVVTETPPALVPLCIYVEDFVRDAVVAAKLTATCGNTKHTDEEGFASIESNEGSDVILLSAYLAKRSITVGEIGDVADDAGCHTRLANLGYFGQPVGDDPDPAELRLAVELLQADADLPITGEMNDPTRAALRTLYGC